MSQVILEEVEKNGWESRLVRRPQTSNKHCHPQGWVKVLSKGAGEHTVGVLSVWCFIPTNCRGAPPIGQLGSLETLAHLALTLNSYLEVWMPGEAGLTQFPARFQLSQWAVLIWMPPTMPTMVVRSGEVTSINRRANADIFHFWTLILFQGVERITVWTYFFFWGLRESQMCCVCVCVLGWWWLAGQGVGRTTSHKHREWWSQDWNSAHILPHACESEKHNCSSHAGTLLKGPRYSGPGYCAQTKALIIQFRERRGDGSKKTWDTHFLEWHLLGPAL